MSATADDVRIEYLERALQLIATMAGGSEAEEVPHAVAELNRYVEGIQENLTPDQKHRFSVQIQEFVEQPKGCDSVPEKNSIGRLLP